MQYPNTLENSLFKYKFKCSFFTNVIALDGLVFRQSNVKKDLYS